MKYLILLTAGLILGQDLIAQDTSKVTSAQPVLDLTTVEPQYPGGEEEMIKFIQANVAYPETALKLYEQGTVYVQFVVNRDGSISDIVVIKGICDVLDAEAIRVVKLMPNWKPGELDGKLVRVRYVIPINFQISDGPIEDKKKKKRTK
jgi:TonB family protein